MPEDYTDLNNVLFKSLNIVEDINNRFTQIWIYYNQFNQTTDKSNGQNYRALDVRVNIDAENENAYDEVNAKFIQANWLDSGNTPIVNRIGRKLLLKDLLQNYIVTFRLDGKDAPKLWTGQFCLLKSDSVVDEQGKQSTQKVQITSVKEIKNGTEFEYIGNSKVFIDPNIFGALIAIAQNGLPDYEAATEQQKDENFFITYGDAPFPDGRPPYRIAGEF